MRQRRAIVEPREGMYGGGADDENKYSTFSASLCQCLCHTEAEASASSCYDVDAVFNVEVLELFVANCIGQVIRVVPFLRTRVCDGLLREQWPKGYIAWLCS